MSTHPARIEPPSFVPDDVPEPQPRAPVLQWGAFAVRAARRHKILFGALLALGLAATLTYYKSRTPLYRVEAKILTQRQQALPSAVRPSIDDAPTRSAWEIVHRRENLIALIDEAKLLARREARGRSSVPVLALGGAKPLSDEDRLNALVLELDRALAVTTFDGTLTISLDWPEPAEAYHLVSGALQNFLEARHLQEVTAIDEVISVLEGRAALARDRLVAVIAEVRREYATGLPGPAPAAPRDDEQLVRLRTMLEAKERAIRDVEEFRRRRLADVQAQLDAARGVYSSAHPTVVTLTQDIEAISRDSPQIIALRDEERQLQRDLAAALAKRGRPDASPTGGVRPRRAGESVEDDERVRDARAHYQNMVQRVASAQSELDSARAAFKYRYNVVWPPQLPKRPLSPNRTKILGAGALASLLLALLIVAVADLRSGRLLERWQVERAIRVPVLGELRRVDGR
jgi:hypothetical protein